MTQQLLLDLGTPPPATFDNFIASTNQEAVAQLKGWPAALAGGIAADRSVYLWGEPGTGRTHLLQALCHAADNARCSARYLEPRSPLTAFVFDERTYVYGIDDCEKLSPAQQIAAFNLFNEIRARPHCAFAAAGAAAPMALPLREDLRTRLGWGLVFQVTALNDEGKMLALQTAAKERGLVLASDVPPYLLTHFRRDMPSLMALLDALDRFSLEQKRAVTLPLLRQMLSHADGTMAGSSQ